ncbi:hypothetical protein D3C75_1091850 [compost metagenome]
MLPLPHGGFPVSCGANPGDGQSGQTERFQNSRFILGVIHAVLADVLQNELPRVRQHRIGQAAVAAREGLDTPDMSDIIPLLKECVHFSQYSFPSSVLWRKPYSIR